MWEITTFFYDTCVPPRRRRQTGVSQSCGKGGKDPLAGRGFARLSAHVHFLGQKSPHFSIIHEIDIAHIGQFTGGLVEIKEDETS